MKRIATHGIFYIERVDGSTEWYWGSDYAEGDLYEAEELYSDKSTIKSNRLVLVHYPDGRVTEPVLADAGQYLGRPLFCEGRLYLLMVDFLERTINILRCDEHAEHTEIETCLPLSVVKDCYNLRLMGKPLMLTRSGNDEKFQIIWPERIDIDVDDNESFMCRHGDRLYFSKWLEDGEYYEAVVVRSYPECELIETIHGAWQDMPDGQEWIVG